MRGFWGLIDSWISEFKELQLLTVWLLWGTPGWVPKTTVSFEIFIQTVLKGLRALLLWKHKYTKKNPLKISLCDFQKTSILREVYLRGLIQMTARKWVITLSAFLFLLCYDFN